MMKSILRDEDAE